MLELQNAILIRMWIMIWTQVIYMGAGQYNFFIKEINFYCERMGLLTLFQGFLPQPEMYAEEFLLNG